MDILLPLLTLVIGLLAGACFVLAWSRRDPAPGLTAVLTARGEDQAVIREGLERLHDTMRDLESQRISWQSQLHQQVDEVRHSTDTLRRETAGLSTALRKPQVRGQWGEMHLRRTVELAGLVNRCDFTEQASVSHDGRALRPDLVVHLPGDKSVVVDAKVPLDAFLDATSADDESEAARHLARHAARLRTHINQLSSKAYWRALSQAPEFVVLFLPAESFYAAALEAEPQLLEYAAGKNVVLATPTMLIGLLRTIAHGWTQQALAQQTREVHELGRTLHERIGKVAGHFDRLGRSLGNAVDSYNSAIGSLESRVLVTARQFEDLSVTSAAIDAPSRLTSTARELRAPELGVAPRSDAAGFEALPTRTELELFSSERPPPDPGERAG